MSRSLRRTHTFRGKTTTETARVMGAQRKGPEGLAFPVAAPSAEAFRKHVEAGICPFCGRGPFKVVANHTARAHSTDRFQLRELCGLPRYSKITDPTYRAERAEMARAAYMEGRTLQPDDVKRGAAKKRTLGIAARQAQKAKGEAARSKHPDLMDRAAHAFAEAKATEMRPVYELAAATYDRLSEGRPLSYGLMAQVARELGWPVGTTQRRLRSAWEMGLGVRRERATRETRLCLMCGSEFLASPTSTKKTCSRSCGAKLNGMRSQKPAATATCAVCGETFTYKRPGTKPRLLCDSTECRAEHARRTRRQDRSSSGE